MQFTYFWPWWAIIIGFTLMAAVTAYDYLRLKRSLSWRLKSLLITLRISATAVLFFCLLDPVVIEKKDIAPPMNLPILTDTTQSMQLQDVELDGEPSTRLALANHLLFNPSSQFLPRLDKRFDTHLYQFNQQSQQISEQTKQLETRGGLTNIAASIQSVAKEWNGQQTAGMVLITDGAHNASTFAIDNVLKLKIPIYPIGIGKPEPPKDLKITRIEVSPVVYVNHEVPVHITIQHTGYSGNRVRLSLREAGEIDTEGRVMDATTVTLTDDSTHLVTFALIPNSEGTFQYVASLPILEGELSTENNKKIFPLKVVKTKLRILYIDGRPRWDYVFLKRFLEQDPNIDATCVILSSRRQHQLRETLLSRTDGYYLQSTESDEMQKFPETLQELMVYDIIIVGDILSNHLNAVQQSAIVNVVEKGGKAIIFLGGRRSLGIDGLNTTALANLLPAVIPANGSSVHDEDFSVELTRDGLYHPITRLADTQANNQSVWRDLPPLSRRLSGFQLRGGATELAVYRRSISSQPMPIIIFQRSGLGKSLLIAAEGVWNWGFGVWSFKDEDNTYSRFWGQTVRWLATRGDAKQISVATSLPVYAVGDDIAITVFAYDESYQPLNNANIKLEVVPPNGKPFQLRTTIDSTNVGGYIAQFNAKKQGTYRIEVSGSQGEFVLGKDSTEIFVESQLAELENPELNESLLRELASETGGIYLSIAQASTLPGKINALKRPIFVMEEREFWDTPIILLCVVGLLGAEWFLRKRIGLI